MKAVLLICAALIACTFADEKKSFRPNDLGCKYHLSYEWEDEEGRINVVDEYGLHTSNDVFYMHEVGRNKDNMSQILFYGTRSYKLKVPDSSDVYAIYMELGGEEPYCDVSEEDPYATYYDSPFEYVSDEDCACVNTSLSGCHCYTNATGFTVVVDSYGRYVRDFEGYDLTYYDDFDISLEDFAISCEDKTVETPEDICAAPRTFTPGPLPCMFHMRYLWEDDDGSYIMDDYCMSTSDTNFITYEVGWNASDPEKEVFHGIVDSKRKLDSGKYSDLYFYPDGTCQVEEEDIYFPTASFDYETGPNAIDCPDGKSQGCHVYWVREHWKKENKRVIVDKDNHYLLNPSGIVIVSYDDDKIDIKNYYPTCEAAHVTIENRGDLCAASASTAVVSVALMVIAAVALLL